MRIVHIANFSWLTKTRKRIDDLGRYYAMDRKVSNGLIRNGHSLWDFSYRDMVRQLSPLHIGKKIGKKRMNDYLLKLARQFNPDLILLGYCESITKETLQQFREILPKSKIAQWLVDTPPISVLQNNLKFLDALFMTIAPSFIYKHLGNDCPSPPIYYMPNIIDSSIEIGRAFEKDNPRYDLFFAGVDVPVRRKILGRVEEMSELNLGLFGYGGRKKIGGYDLITTISNSKMGLNINRSNIPLGSSDRISHIIGNGSLVLSQRIPDMDALYTEDEVVYFDNDDMLVEMINRYAKDESARKTIAKAGWQRAHTSHNEKRVTQFMIEAIFGGGDNNAFSQPYEWLPFTVFPKTSA